jgi:hypothetical protein
MAAHVLDSARDGDVVRTESDSRSCGGHGGHGSGAHPVDRETGHRPWKSSKQRGRTPNGQTLVADLRRCGDSDIVDAFRRQLRMTA